MGESTASHAESPHLELCDHHELYPSVPCPCRWPSQLIWCGVSQGHTLPWASCPPQTFNGPPLPFPSTHTTALPVPHRTLLLLCIVASLSPHEQVACRGTGVRCVHCTRRCWAHVEWMDDGRGSGARREPMGWGREWGPEQNG